MLRHAAYAVLYEMVNKAMKHVIEMRQGPDGVFYWFRPVPAVNRPRHQNHGFGKRASSSPYSKHNLRHGSVNPGEQVNKSRYSERQATHYVRAWVWVVIVGIMLVSACKFNQVPPRVELKPWEAVFDHKRR